MQIKQIAYIRSDFMEKFGIPRQSNLADTRAEIHFLPEYQNADALREIEAYDYLWLIWEFSESIRDTWSPTVRPPRLGRCGSSGYDANLRYQALPSIRG